MRSVTEILEEVCKGRTLLDRLASGGVVNQVFVGEGDAIPYRVNRLTFTYNRKKDMKELSMHITYVPQQDYFPTSTKEIEGTEDFYPVMEHLTDLELEAAKKYREEVVKDNERARRKARGK